MFDIKPLEWVQTGSGNAYVASTVFGDMGVRFTSGQGWARDFCFAEGYDEGDVPCGGLEAGQIEAEAFYRERLMAALAPAVPGRQVAGVRVLKAGVLPPPKPLTGTCRLCGCQVEADADAGAIATRRVERSVRGADPTPATATIRDVPCPTPGCTRRIELRD